MKNEAELRILIEQKMRVAMPGMIDAMMKFQEDPNANTFKDAENIPDALVGKALDEIVAELLRDTAKTPPPAAESSASQKKEVTDNDK